MNELIEDAQFSGVDFTLKKMKKGDYEGCSFMNCNFSNADISNCMFMDCEFVDCDLSSANIAHTTLKEVSFSNCKMMGLHFQKCSSLFFSALFTNCVLDFSSFAGRSLEPLQFSNCSLKGVDFTEASMMKVIFDDCNFDQAIFDGTVLKETDLRTSFNFNIDPASNVINKALFTKENVSGLLKKYNIVIE